MSIVFLVLCVVFVVFAAIAYLFDAPRVFGFFGAIALAFASFYSNATASEQREQMHQCLKDGGQWVQYSRSGFECVRGGK